MAWNLKDAWPESNKTLVRRRVKELQQQTETAEQLAEARTKKIEKMQQQIAKLEKQGDENG